MRTPCALFRDKKYCIWTIYTFKHTNCRELSLVVSIFTVQIKNKPKCYGMLQVCRCLLNFLVLISLFVFPNSALFCLKRSDVGKIDNCRRNAYIEYMAFNLTAACLAFTQRTPSNEHTIHTSHTHTYYTTPLFKTPYAQTPIHLTRPYEYCTRSSTTNRFWRPILSTQEWWSAQHEINSLMRTHMALPCGNRSFFCALRWPSTF